MNDTKCAEALVNFDIACKNVHTWGRNSTMPTCSDECQKWITELDNNAITKHMKCCECGNDKNVTINQRCSLVQSNIKELCGRKPENPKQCQHFKSACEHEKLKEMTINREGKYFMLYIVVLDGFITRSVSTKDL